MRFLTIEEIISLTFLVLCLSCCVLLPCCIISSLRRIYKEWKSKRDELKRQIQRVLIPRKRLAEFRQRNPPSGEAVEAPAKVYELIDYKRYLPSAEWCDGMAAIDKTRRPEE